MEIIRYSWGHLNMSGYNWLKVWKYSNIKKCISFSSGFLKIVQLGKRMTLIRIWNLILSLWNNFLVILGVVSAAEFGMDGRPFHFLFYTSLPNYYQLMHVSFELCKSTFFLKICINLNLLSCSTTQSHYLHVFYAWGCIYITHCFKIFWNINSYKLFFFTVVS